MCLGFFFAKICLKGRNKKGLIKNYVEFPILVDCYLVRF
jgi:hypothetical protein